MHEIDVRRLDGSGKFFQCYLFVFSNINIFTDTGYSLTHLRQLRITVISEVDERFLRSVVFR